MTPPNTPSLDELAAGEIDAADERALARLAGMYDTLDPMPAGLVDRIKFGITLDSLTAEIAELQRSGDLAGARSEATASSVTFTSASVTVMITVTVLSKDRARVDGWAAPGGGVVVTARTVDGEHTETADADGRFVFSDVVRGLFQLTVRQPDGAAGAPVVTPSIEI